MSENTSPTAGELSLVAGSSDGGRRLDEFLASALSIGRRAAMRLMPRVRVNGQRASKGQRLRSGDAVWLCPEATDVGPPRDAALEVVRATAQVLVLAKPAALASVALRGRGGDTLAARIARHFPECAAVGQPGEAGLVHRLDTGTSGLLLAARTADAYAALRAQFRGHRVRKEYLAMVSGRVAQPVRIATPIGQHRHARRRMRAVASERAALRYAPRPACTEVTPERFLPSATLVRAATATGVRHQIRVHLASIGHPLINDALYGGREVVAIEGFLLHATRIEWRDPELDDTVCDELPPPASWQRALAELEHGPP